MSLAETLFNSIFKKGVGPGTIRVLHYVIVAMIFSIGFALLTGAGNVHLYVLLFLCAVVAYVDRIGFSIAWTAMADQHHLSQTQKGGVLSAFYYGYGLTQIPASWIISRRRGHERKGGGGAGVGGQRGMLGSGG